MKSTILSFAAVLVMAVAFGAEPTLEAPSLTPEKVVGSTPLSVMTVEQCGNLVALITVDEFGELHPMDLEGKTTSDIQTLLASILPDDPARRISVEVPCPPPRGALRT